MQSLLRMPIIQSSSVDLIVHVHSLVSRYGVETKCSWVQPARADIGYKLSVEGAWLQESRFIVSSSTQHGNSYTIRLYK